jgi:hypothetical protein
LVRQTPVVGHFDLDQTGRESAGLFLGLAELDQDLVTRPEEIGPARAQMREERLLVREQEVMAALERIDPGTTHVDPEQVSEGGALEPVPVQPPLRARREQPVDHEIRKFWVSFNLPG